MAICGAKVLQQEMKKQLQAFVGLLIAVKSKGMEGQSDEDPSSEVQNIKWEDLIDGIWKVCEEFAAVFPKDLPKGVPPK